MNYILLLKEFVLSIIIVTVLFFSVLNAQEQKPEKHYNITVKSDKADALYKINENIRFQISFQENGKRIPGKKINYTLKRDGHPLETGTINSTETFTTLETSLDKPGFVLCSLLYKHENGKRVTALAGVGVAPLEIEAGGDTPSDFHLFWANKINKLKKLPLEVKMVPVAVPKKFKERVNCFDIKVNCLGGTPVSGYLAKPLNAEKKSLPALISFHGAGVTDSNKMKPCLKAAQGMISMDINAHGIENGKPKEFYKKIISNELKNYRFKGIEDKEKIYFSGMFLRVYRALQFLKSQPEWDGKILIVTGDSQGGGQALVAAGLDPQVSLCIARFPALCDHLALLKKRTCGWPKFIVSAKRLNMDIQKVTDTIAYFDAANFAKNIKAEAILTVGFIDASCCPTSVYAAYNNIKSEKMIINNINLGHTHSGNASTIIKQKLKEHLSKKEGN